MELRFVSVLGFAIALATGLPSALAAAATCSQHIAVQNPGGDLEFGVMTEPPPSNPSVWLGIFPEALVVDSTGNLYVADQLNYRVLKFDKRGKYQLTVHLQAPSGKKPELSYWLPALAVDRQDNLYVVNMHEQRVEIYRADGTYRKSINYRRAEVWAERMSIDRLGNVYLFSETDRGGGVYSPEGELIQRDVVVDRSGKGIKNYDETQMVGFSGYYYEFGTDGKSFDKVIYRNRSGEVVKTCPIAGVRPVRVGISIIYTDDLDGNVYFFDNETLDIIRISPRR